MSRDGRIAELEGQLGAAQRAQAQLQEQVQELRATAQAAEAQVGASAGRVHLCGHMLHSWVAVPRSDIPPCLG